MEKVKLSGVFRRLREIARSKGETNRTLAEKMGVNPTNLSRWTTGSDGREPSLAVVRWMAEYTDRAVVMTPEGFLIIPLRAARVLAGYGDEAE